MWIHIKPRNFLSFLQSVSLLNYNEDIVWFGFGGVNSNSLELLDSFIKYVFEYDWIPYDFEICDWGWFWEKFWKLIAIMSGRVLWVLWFKSLSLKIIEHVAIFFVYSILLMKRRNWINWVREVQSCFALESVDGSLRRNTSWYQILEKWSRQILS